ncbi:MAG: hypothetical protein AB7Q17_09100 [Phycisphaerae bacterium]
MMLSLMLASAAWWGGLAAVGGAVGALAFERWRRARRPSASDVLREQRARIRDQRGLQRTLEELLANVERVAERVERDTESRIAQLEALLRSADERLRRASAEPPPSAAAAPIADGEARAGSLRARVAAARARRPALSIVRPAIGEVGAATSTTARRQSVLAAGAGAAPAIAELLGAGMTTESVAERLDAPIGEVELFAALRAYAPESNEVEAAVRVA